MKGKSVDILAVALQICATMRTISQSAIGPMLRHVMTSSTSTSNNTLESLVCGPGRTQHARSSWVELCLHQINLEYYESRAVKKLRLTCERERTSSSDYG